MPVFPEKDTALQVLEAQGERRQHAQQTERSKGVRASETNDSVPLESHLARTLWWPRSLVQKNEEVVDFSKRPLVHLADVNDPIAVTLQRSRPGFPKPSGQEGRGYGLWSDIQSNDSPSPAVDPEPCCGKEVAGCRRQFTKTTGGLLFQVVQFVFASTRGGAGVDFEPNRLRLHVVWRQHVCNRQI